MAVSTTDTTICEESPATAGVEIFRTVRERALSGRRFMYDRGCSGA